MPSVTIDASVIAAPPANTEHEVVHQYVETLRALKKLDQKTWVAIYTSEFTAEVLIADGLYPLRPALNTLFKRCGITEYDANTVAILAESFLSQPSCEEVFGINEVLAEEVTLTPNLSSWVASKNLASNLERCVILMAILRKYCNPPVTDHWLVVNKPIPTSSSPVEEVTVKALIHELEHNRGDEIQGIPVPPAYLEGSVSVLVGPSFSDLIKWLDEKTLLNKAAPQETIEPAIKVAIYKLCLERLERNLSQKRQVEIDEIEEEREKFREWTFGKDFFATVRECCRNRSDLAERLLRSIIETIDRQQLQDTHRLRTGKGGDDPRRKRGQDAAWRRDIDREYHLHYWECEEGMVEFANMVPHNDFSITE
jgi:hypothetical protein